MERKHAILPKIEEKEIREKGVERRGATRGRRVASGGWMVEDGGFRKESERRRVKGVWKST